MAGGVRISREMLSAGAAAIDAYQDAFAETPSPALNSPALARAVYIAMTLAQPHQSRHAARAGQRVPYDESADAN